MAVHPLAERRSSLHATDLLRLLALGLCSAFFVAVVLLPLYWILMASITPRMFLFAQPFHYIPPAATLDNYIAVFNAVPYFRYLLNTVVVTVLASGASVLLSLLAAYAIARIPFRGRDLVFMVFLASLLLPPVATIIPLFQLFKTIRLIDTLLGLLILYTSALLPFTIWVLTSFLRQLPAEIEEAAMIDGANLPQLLLRIVFPLTRPIVATMFVINLIAGWNELIWALIFAQSENSKTLTVGLTEANTAFVQGQPLEAISSMSVMMMVPVLVLTALFQRQIMAGLTAGAVK